MNMFAERVRCLTNIECVPTVFEYDFSSSLKKGFFTMSESLSYTCMTFFFPDLRKKNVIIS